MQVSKVQVLRIFLFIIEPVRPGMPEESYLLKWLKCLKIVSSDKANNLSEWKNNS